MRWLVAVACAIGVGFVVSNATAGEQDEASALVLSNEQLDEVTAAGTIFVGVARGDEVLYSRQTSTPAAVVERSIDIEAGGVRTLIVVTPYDIYIPPSPFPQ